MEKHPKFKEKKNCAFPKRDDCNYGEGYNRCPYMKYNNSKSTFDSTRWECTFIKKKDKNKTEGKNGEKDHATKTN